MVVENSVLSDEEVAELKSKERSMINWFVSLKSPEKSSIQSAFQSGGDLEKKIRLLTEELKNALSKIDGLNENMREIKDFAAATLNKYDKVNYELKNIKGERVELKKQLYEHINLLDKSKYSYNKLLVTHAVTMFELNRVYIKVNGDRNKIVKGGTSSTSHSVNKTSTRRRTRRQGIVSTNTSIEKSANRSQGRFKLNIDSILKNTLAGANNFKKKDNPERNVKNALEKIKTDDILLSIKIPEKNIKYDTILEKESPLCESPLIEGKFLQIDSPLSSNKTRRSMLIEEGQSIRTISAKIYEGMITDRSGIGQG